MAVSDEPSLLTRALTYDGAALGELYEQYAPKIYTYILYQVGDDRLAEDLTANVFRKMLDAVRASKGWQQSFTSWLYRIAHNVVVDHYRRARNTESLPLDERLASGTDDPVATVERRLSREDIKQALLCLTLDQREVIALKFFEGFSNLETAHVMGKTEGAIKSLQYRALGALRRQLEEMWGRGHVQGA
ncbi:MAG: sigma-70 family RNA polymerase sigma factor [Chloroflexota bacterium]